ncbi:MAG TPA: prepilin-type N-terminal cleavage/methylation domain-containing protein [Burkholderiaceae bacterium]
MTPRASARSPARPSAGARGFSLLELMVVLLIVAIGTGMVTLVLRDSAQDKLDEEGARLAAILESARAQSRIVGTDVRWQPTQDGTAFEFVGLPSLTSAQLPTHWLDPDTRAEIVGQPQVLLGPEPLLPQQRILLHLRDQTVAVGTDGLSPFEVLDDQKVAAQ